ncbi:MAG TPA: dCTP deaminase [Oligoflexia bacterium]|nr:dCTP deaminase [Oligoflexia bacterium]HMP26680.1 dCTP deaminase [Oligoflexia bacterium]
MVKPDHWITQFASTGGISPFNPEFVNPASYDVTVGNHWICPTRQPEEFTADEIILFPGEVVLATTQEYIKMPRNVVADLKLKSSLGRLWLNHSMSGWIDPNFQGQITLELQNLGPYPRKLRAGMRVAQLVFTQMDGDPDIAYGELGKGHYQGQQGATKAWSEEFFTPFGANQASGGHASRIDKGKTTNKPL